MITDILIAMLAAGLATVACIVQFRRILREKRDYLQTLKDRAHTVDRLLTFSQTIQGAGRIDQIYLTLSRFLRMELGLAGLVVLSHDPEMVPPTTQVAVWPEDLMTAAPRLTDLETSLCPCLRQSLPWHFDPGNSPVRCVIDPSMRLSAEHPAYCVPFNFGPRVRVVVHMLLSPGEAWTEHRRQLAQAYVNSAQSALSSLQLLAEAERQSMTDGLTGLYNRRSLDQLFMREVALAERYGHPLSVVMVDIDRFKSINDAHGHAAGDHLLKSFADCIRITLRKTDLAFRYGGDEFVVALPQTNTVQAQQVMQKLRQAFAAVDFSHAITKLVTQPTLSIGVAERSAGNNVLTMAQMLAAADQALYMAKNGERNCIRVYEPPGAA
jgi:diguanylate cyclase (GGDEF)-like protein